MFVLKYCIRHNFIKLSFFFITLDCSDSIGIATGTMKSTATYNSQNIFGCFNQEYL